VSGSRLIGELMAHVEIEAADIEKAKAKAKENAAQMGQQGGGRK
jgi:hypothetical protein